MSSEFAFVAIFELFLAAAPLAVFLNTGVEVDDLTFVFRCERCCRRVDQGQQFSRETHCHSASAIELPGSPEECLATFGECRIGGKHACAIEVAERSLGCNHRSGRVDALGQEPGRDDVGTDRAEVDACTAR